MATYGNFPGVRITTTGGGLTGVSVGSEETLVLYGVGSGDPSSSDNELADYNDPTQINSLSDADRFFGEGSPLAEAVKQAVSNGANRDFLYGVRVEEPEATDENIGNGTAATNHTDGVRIANTPLLEDESVITVHDGAGATLFSGADGEVNFVFETNTDDSTSDFTSTTADDGEFDINPLTGEWRDDGTGADYYIDYTWHDYEKGLDAAEIVVDEGDTAILATLTEAPAIHDALVTQVGVMRNNYQLAQAVAGARPNATESGEPAYNTDYYSDTSDDDALYLVAPTRQAGYASQRDSGHPETVIGAVSGLMAAHPITDPVYNDTVSGLDRLGQKLTKTDADNLRDAQVIPVRQGGSIRLKDNRSTSTASDWTRDFWRRRIVDRVILISKQVGDDTIGRINDDETREDAEDVIYSELSSMVDDRLLKPNEDGETRWYVEVTEDANDPDQVNIDLGITPQGIVKRIDQRVTINT